MQRICGVSGAAWKNGTAMCELHVHARFRFGPMGWKRTGSDRHVKKKNARTDSIFSFIAPLSFPNSSKILENTLII